MMYLCNSTVMSSEGMYQLKKLSKEEFILKVRKNRIVSRLGYKQNVELIRKWTLKDIKVNREATNFKEGDTALVMKLNGRVANPKEKGKPKLEDKFTFYEFVYMGIK